MIKIEELNIEDWAKEDLRDLIEENPEVITMSRNEIEKRISNLRWEVEDLYDRANTVEARADVYHLYLEVLGKESNND